MKQRNYEVERNYNELNCDVLVEPDVNHLASSYIAENYEMVINSARKFPGVDPYKVEELVHDVWISIMQSENEGEGFDISHSNVGDIITVDKFVFGRLKLYAKNRKYSRDGVDRHISSRRSDGKSVAFVDFDITFASADTSDPDQMSSIQRAYYNASTYEDNIEAVNDALSLRQNIEFCLEFNSLVGFNFINLFKNIELFSGHVDSSIFDGLHEVIERNEELSEALFNVLTCAKHSKRAITI